MALSSTGIVAGQKIKSAQLLQFYNVLTGIMTDQPITLGNNLTVNLRFAVGGVVYPGTSVALRTVGMTASGGFAQGLFNFSTLVAGANNDALTMSRIDPTFLPGVFTGLTTRGLWINAFSTAAFASAGDTIGIDVGVVTGGGTNAYGIKVGTPTGASNNYGVYSSGIVTVASASATALTVGRLGTTTPALQVDASAATSITGVKITAGAAGGGVAIAAIGETNVILSLNGAGTGAASGVRLGAAGGRVGFYGTTPIALQTGVAVTAAGIHAALVALGLITA